MPNKSAKKQSGNARRRSARSVVPPPIDASVEERLTSIAAEVRRVYSAIPHLGMLRDQVLFGDVWKRAELAPSSRSLVTCAILASLGRQDELCIHVRRAVTNGITADELRGLAVHVAFYAGWPAGLAVGRAALPYLV